MAKSCRRYACSRRSLVACSFALVIAARLGGTGRLLTGLSRARLFTPRRTAGLAGLCAGQQGPIFRAEVAVLRVRGFRRAVPLEVLEGAVDGSNIALQRLLDQPQDQRLRDDYLLRHALLYNGDLS